MVQHPERRQQRGQFLADVVANDSLCREHYRLTLRLAEFPSTEPGQFVQLSCADPEATPEEHELSWSEGDRLEPRGHELNEPQAFLRRPFSLAGWRDVGGGGVELEFIHRVVGLGTNWLSRLKVGDRAGLLGPLGNRFALPAQDEIALMVGGGVGIPPMIYLAGHLARRAAVAFSGALTRDLLPLTIDPAAGTPGADSAEPLMSIGEFARHGIPAVISTDDGSYGFRGFVTQALEKFLDSPASLVRGGKALRPVIYTCGPEPMMKRVARIAMDRGIECQVAVERAMACGMGTCQSCCIKVAKPDASVPPLAGKDWCWRLACTDGPIFRGSELLW